MSFRQVIERRFSADGVKHHKRTRQAYVYVERKLGAQPTRFCLIACHTWEFCERCETDAPDCDQRAVHDV